ncbi:MAG: DUF5640 domain-containing protein [Oscillospiraceae bacterium]|jgi:opacity protein-like surface antigen|nr:DUF5640 domain-containing protein [Oscillospiraceae bacterium]MCI1991068.1 DUF5640 domain-containing protein [Oscillospiraceae bacterium]MCI2035439.1 DUF5640 domain-containing protein [Oscillospiraceae bacterium]
MKKMLFALLLAAAVLLPLAACKPRQPSPADSLIGTWEDNYGLTEYKFETNGRMKIRALNLGSFRGTYRVDGDRINIRYRVLVKAVNETYVLKISGNTMYLDKNQFTRKK